MEAEGRDELGECGDTEMGFVGSTDDEVTAKLLEQLGNVVHDIYLLRRIIVELKESLKMKFAGLVAGMAMGLTTIQPGIGMTWEFSLR